MNRITSILLTIAVLMFCAGCAHCPPKPMSKDHGDTGNITTTNVAMPDDGFSGYLRVKYGNTYSAGHLTTWQYKRHNTSTWSTPVNVGSTTVELAGAIYYDVKFNPPGTDTVVPNPKNNVLVNADKLTDLKLTYTP